MFRKEEMRLLEYLVYRDIYKRLFCKFLAREIVSNIRKEIKSNALS